MCEQHVGGIECGDEKYPRRMGLVCAENKAMALTRSEWSQDFDFCFACGRSNRIGYGDDPGGALWWLETHEIAGGPSRQKSLREPATWLRVCSDCHRGPRGLHHKGVWPVVRQLALKRLYDPQYYNRRRVNELRGRAPEAITEREVSAYLKGGDAWNGL